MRLNSTTFPILHAIETNTWSPEQHFLGKLDEKFNIGRSEIKDRAVVMSLSFKATEDLLKSGMAKYIAKTFDKSIRTAAQKIVNAGDEYRTCQLPPSIYINQNGGTTIYNTEKTPQLKAMFVGFDRNKIVAFATLRSDDYGISGWGDMNWLKQFVTDVKVEMKPNAGVFEPQNPMDVALSPSGERMASQEMHLLLSHWITYHLITNYFVTHCEVETREVKPGEKVKLNGDKHMNESKRKFTVLDCSWFTTLIHTHGHKVNGFFRWQPYGPERALRKLIWIDDFERGPYTRKAKVLTNKDETT